jgi:hypothetical protein
MLRAYIFTPRSGYMDPTIVLKVHSLRGEFFDKVEGQPLNFDRKEPARSEV